MVPLACVVKPDAVVAAEPPCVVVACPLAVVAGAAVLGTFSAVLVPEDAVVSDPGVVVTAESDNYSCLQKLLHH